jgi:hypothetical protein
MREPDEWTPEEEELDEEEDIKFLNKMTDDYNEEIKQQKLFDQKWKEDQLAKQTQKEENEKVLREKKS